MNFKDIEKLVELFSKKQISKLSLKEGDFELTLQNELPNPSPIPLSPSPAPVAPAPSAPLAAPAPQECEKSHEGLFIQSPMVGTFYHCPSPDAPPYVKVGDKIKKGQIIGIVEAMKIMNEIEAEFDCKVIEITADDAQPVEFGSKLIKVEKL